MKKMIMEVAIAAVIIVGAILVRQILISKQTCKIDGISIPYDQQDTKITVGGKIMEKYLSSYKTKKTCPQSWLETYKINSIKTSGTTTLDNDQFIVDINYSVKPQNKTSSSWSDGISTDQNGWINNKEMVVNVIKEGNFFKLINQDK
jgi:hypothetical protein